jgi:hypothetical protein
MAEVPTRRSLPKSGPIIDGRVSEEIVIRSEERSSSHCLIAEAVKVALPQFTKVAVDLQTIRVTDPKKGIRYIYLTPRECQLALVNFDQGIHTEPFSFRARVVQVARASVTGGKRKPAEPKEPRSPRTGNAGEPKTMLSAGKNPVHIGGKVAPVSVYRKGRRTFGLKTLQP